MQVFEVLSHAAVVEQHVHRIAVNARLLENAVDVKIHGNNREFVVDEDGFGFTKQE